MVTSCETQTLTCKELFTDLTKQFTLTPFSKSLLAKPMVQNHYIQATERNKEIPQIDPSTSPTSYHTLFYSDLSILLTEMLLSESI